MYLSAFVSKMESAFVGRDDSAQPGTLEEFGIAQAYTGKVTDSPEMGGKSQTGTAGTPGAAFPTQSPDG